MITNKIVTIFVAFLLTMTIVFSFVYVMSYNQFQPLPVWSELVWGDSDHDILEDKWVEDCSNTEPRCCVKRNAILPQFKAKPWPEYTVEDRISPIDMKLMADFHFGKLPQPEQYPLRELDASKPDNYFPCFRNGTVIFVDSNHINEFVDTILPLIQTTFVLVTGDSDSSMPDGTITLSRLILLQKTGLVLHWYAINCDLQRHPWQLEYRFQSTSLDHRAFNELLPSDLFTCIPNGINQWANQREEMQQTYSEGLGLTTLQWPPENSVAVKRKEQPILVAFNVESNPDFRKPVWAMACSKPDDRFLCFKEDISLQDYYRNILLPSTFVLSPIGAGLDCYRTYETLYLGAVPVVKSSPLDEIYDGLPVVIVKNWEEILQPGWIEEQRDKMFNSTTEWQMEKLFSKYWYAKFRSHSPFHYNFPDI